MIDLTHLLDEQTLRGVEVEVGCLAIQELTGDASDGDDGDIRGFCLSRQLFCRELLLWI